MDKIMDIINSYIFDIDNKKQINMYYEIGHYIKENNIDIKKLTLYIRENLGLTIAFTDRNLNNMIKFSNYNKSLLNKLEQITWKNILVIMKHDESLIDLCIKYKPTKQELEDYINIHKKLKNNDIIEMDDTLEELINLRK